ncbi:hypothetical protein VOLCADRAFT_105711 [Volvox carteri f. nagariensis]|uniref:6-phosphofructo-2-kinase domain-containing protein n=1 Tax=Volvox carteri f. nagariensis TaxID=3068 RepID=D8U2I3_VOLCA|nr:uncharacterized protein VOLCADRAFT_105711 [Volvox carteri f. nagariensis]EFJ46141.1 hypothetical protein VOLCADRAFT_105711 [Volvox carteri f. nagariensis]|eukprot:XP_002952891.1 hypothetical protein VOLCADRAFT_105711 [Volvox carteri f. nagariensis]
MLQVLSPSPLGLATPLPNPSSSTHPATTPLGCQPESQPQPESQNSALLPSLASRSAPISASNPAHSLEAQQSTSYNQLTPGGGGGGPLHVASSSSFHPGGGSGAAGTTRGSASVSLNGINGGVSLRGNSGSSLGRSMLLFPSTAELARRLRGLVTNAAVNFRDVELMPKPQPPEGDMEGLMEGLMDQQGEEPDADAATGSTAASASLAAAAAEVIGRNGSGGGGGGGAAAAAAAAGGVGAGSDGDGSGDDGGHGAADGAAAAAAAAVAAAGGLPLPPMPLAAGVVAGVSAGCSRVRTSGAVVRKNKLVIIMRHADQMQDAEFFDHTNEAGLEARHRALNAALDDLTAWLRSDQGQVAVFDATNTTESRRNLLAVADFLARISKYEEVYEPINDRNLHYIKLIDMVTGRGHMDINRISGYLPGKIVFFLMQICKAGMTSVRKIWLSRHGESEYNQKGLIGGNSSLSERGERYSRALPGALIARLPQEQPVSVAVWTSTLKRTIETARFLPFPKLRWKALDEIDAGICDGMTYEQIAERYPQEYEARKKDKLRYRYPSGESYMDVIQRVEPVIIELERERESVLVVAHQAVLRAVYAYFMNVPPEDIPRLSMPLHTLIELTPMPDGTMSEQRFPLDIDIGVGVGVGIDVEVVQEPAVGGPSAVGPSGPAAKGVVDGDGAARGAAECFAAAAEEVATEMAAAAAAAAAEAAGSGSPLSSVNSGGSCMAMMMSMQEGGGSLVLPASPASSSPGSATTGRDDEAVTDVVEAMGLAAGPAAAAAAVATAQ